MFEENTKKYLDKTLPIEVRKASFNEEMDKIMNPIPKNLFNPKDFDPISPDEDLEKEIYARARKKQEGKFPTFGIEPKVVREGQMIGMFESKQDIYLLFAHKINDLIDEIQILKDEINKLKKTPNNI